MQGEAWGPIWGLAGTNGQNWLWVEQMAEEAAGKEQETAGLADEFGFLVQGPEGRHRGTPGGDGRAFLLERAS